MASWIMPLRLRAADRWSAHSNAVATFSLLPADTQLSGRVRNRVTMRPLTWAEKPGKPPKRGGCRFESCRPGQTKAPLKRGFQVRRRRDGRTRVLLTLPRPALERSAERTPRPRSVSLNAKTGPASGEQRGPAIQRTRRRLARRLRPRRNRRCQRSPYRRPLRSLLPSTRAWRRMPARPRLTRTCG